MNRTLVVVLLSSLILQGCAFAPGQHMTPDDVTANDPNEPKAQLVAITPGNLQQQQQHAASDARALPQELLDYKTPEYVVGPGDTLLVTVFEHPELTAPGSQDQLDANTREVLGDGTLFFPYVGRIMAGGKTVSQIREQLRMGLSPQYTEVKVDVKVLRYNSQRVLLSGSFKTPGPQPITNIPLSLVQAVSIAGVDLTDANLAGLTLRRNGRDYLIDIDALNRKGSQLSRIFLKDGDYLHLNSNSRNKIYVLGEVRNPQVISFGTTSVTLLEALGTSGGLSPESADGDAVYVIRGAENIANATSTVYHLAAKKPTAYLLAGQFELKAQDVVFVGPADITRWSRFISQLLGSASVVQTGAAFRN
ncbi:polysaccharide biosynthesis/export family protein [Pseudomonas sp. CDFA 602]|uniref:polysaccharide biosynthesis/export family protein n=1 Tax=Pseudomonas californiensis TaxID=2829823 RepID=UPI001E40B01A|nr:polysaccharide biosynthesis/export family protein [Pseudomonas californiensis]MCD5992717.1 polysaccharide biosynthesis/export family protein [Pseudomonas californiensis]MCD5998597.1 polysaccharide biosynthesis/export family protein [Pseudomonas californiensis]